MKKIKAIFASMAMAITVLATCAMFTSCSDDDKDEPETPAATAITGSYTGDMTCSVMGSESTFEDLTITIASTDDATVSITLASFGEPPMQVPEITITGVKVAGTDGTYSIAESQFSGTTSSGRAYSGTTKGSVVDNNLTLNLQLQYGAMPMPMICTFTAPKK